MRFGNWPSSKSYTPITYIRGVPVDATLLITATHILTMLVVAIAMASGVDYMVIRDAFCFQTDFLMTGKIWTIVTYPFVHNISMELLWFAVGMFMFYWFGREVERFIGRSSFLWFYALLVLVPPLIMMVVSFVAGRPIILDNERFIHLAVFIGFTIIYPNVVFFFGILAKWLAIIFLAIYTLAFLADQNIYSLIWLWTTVAVGWFTLKAGGVGGGLDIFHWFDSWKMDQHQAQMEKRKKQYEEKERVEEHSVDDILDKIKNEGMESLTPEERRILEKTSQRLSNRDKYRD